MQDGYKLRQPWKHNISISIKLKPNDTRWLIRKSNLTNIQYRNETLDRNTLEIQCKYSRIEVVIKPVLGNIEWQPEIA
jgi:hypothetical protein